MAITDKNLTALVRQLNQITGMPVDTYVNGAYQIGNFHVDHAYGRVALLRVVSEAGACTDEGGGFHTKRELYERIYAFIRGYEFAKRQAA